jgi:hypothetical protein
MSQYRYFLPDEILLAIGRITVNFAILELAIAGYIDALLAPQHQDVGRAVTANMSFKNLVNLLSSLHRLRVDDQVEQKRLDALLAGALTLEERRNVVTHSRWALDQDPREVVRWKTTARREKGLHDHFQKMTDAELHSLANELTQLYADMMNFMVESKWIQDNAMATIDLSDRTTSQTNHRHSG